MEGFDYVLYLIGFFAVGFLVGKFLLYIKERMS